MRYSLLAVGAVASVSVAVAVVVAADPPKLGAEWSYDKEMQEYRKTMPIKVTRPAAGVSDQNYHLELRHDKFVIGDTDENTSTGVRVNDTINLELRKNPKGGPGKVTVVMNKCAYLDL